MSKEIVTSVTTAGTTETVSNQFKVVNTLVAGREGNENAKILGYVLENKESGNKKGFTVEEAAALVHQGGADNADVIIRPVVKDGEETFTLYLSGKGKNDDDSNFSLRQPELVLPIINPATNAPWCDYSEGLSELAERRITRGRSEEETKAEREAKIAEILKTKGLTNVSF